MKLMVAVDAADAAIAGLSGSGGSVSDDSDSCDVTRAPKLSADASPRASRRDTPPPELTTAEIERQLRNAQKLLREILKLMEKPVEAMNNDQRAKLLRYGDTQSEVDRLQSALAADVAEPEDTGSAFASGEEGADYEMDPDAAAASAARYRIHPADEYSEASCSSGTSGRLSLGSVVSAASYQPSEYYVEPPPPTPPPPPPPLRRSDVKANISAADAYSMQERIVRQIQASYRRKLAQRQRRVREAASQAAIGAFEVALERGRGAVDRAKGINSAFIKGVRDEARKQLRDADSAGSMPFKPDVRPAPPVSPRTRKAIQAQGGSAEASILL